MTKFLSILILIFVVGFAGFFINEARKEIYYLCGNFTKDKTIESVLKQLKTIRFSQYKILTISNYQNNFSGFVNQNQKAGSPKYHHQYLILLQSPLTFKRSNCKVYFQSKTNFDELGKGELSLRNLEFQQEIPELLVESTNYKGLF